MPRITKYIYYQEYNIMVTSKGPKNVFFASYYISETADNGKDLKWCEEIEGKTLQKKSYFAIYETSVAHTVHSAGQIWQPWPAGKGCAKTGQEHSHFRRRLFYPAHSADFFTVWPASPRWSSASLPFPFFARMQTDLVKCAQNQGWPIYFSKSLKF